MGQFNNDTLIQRIDLSHCYYDPSEEYVVHCHSYPLEDYSIHHYFYIFYFFKKNIFSYKFGDYGHGLFTISGLEWSEQVLGY